MLLLPGCASWRYRMQRKYRYAPKTKTPTSYTKSTKANSARLRTTTPTPKVKATATPRTTRTRTSAPAPKVSAPAPVLQASAPKGSVADASPTVYRLRPGDPIIIYLRGVPGVPGGEQMIEDQVDENGAITLPFINQVYVGSKTTSEVEDIVRNAYLDQKIYKYITVNAMVPARSYYVRGEVQKPGRYPIISEVSIVQAIAAAGGFTEFASPRKVEVLPGTKKFRVDVRELEKYPDRDKALEAGDVLIVHRSFF